MSATPAAPAGRLWEAVRGIPLVTLSLTVFLALVFAADYAGDYSANLSLFAISASAVVDAGQAWRLVTSAFVHGGLLHLAMNSATLLALGGGLEPSLGSAAFAWALALLTPLTGVLYVGLAAVAAALPAALPGCGPAAWHAPAVGFSGVLFALAVDEAALSPAPRRSVFGLFSVPTALYPWVLMALLSLVLPNISFMGHLAGLLAGCAHSAGGLAWALPRLPTLRRCEAAPCCAPLVR